MLSTCKLVNVPGILVIPEPSEVALSTDVPSIKYSFPTAKSKCSLDVQLSVAFIQLKILSVLPFTVIPPPLAFESVGESTLFRVMFGSSVVNCCTSIDVVLPEIITLPSIFKFLMELLAMLQIL